MPRINSAIVRSSPRPKYLIKDRRAFRTLLAANLADGAGSSGIPGQLGVPGCVRQLLAEQPRRPTGCQPWRLPQAPRRSGLEAGWWLCVYSCHHYSTDTACGLGHQVTFILGETGAVARSSPRFTLEELTHSGVWLFESRTAMVMRSIQTEEHVDSVWIGTVGLTGSTNA